MADYRPARPADAFIWAMGELGVKDAAGSIEHSCPMRVKREFTGMKRYAGGKSVKSQRKRSGNYIEINATGKR